FQTGVEGVVCGTRAAAGPKFGARKLHARLTGEVPVKPDAAPGGYNAAGSLIGINHFQPIRRTLDEGQAVPRLRLRPILHFFGRPAPLRPGHANRLRRLRFAMGHALDDVVHWRPTPSAVPRSSWSVHIWDAEEQIG